MLEDLLDAIQMLHQDCLLKKKKLECSGVLIERAGWHFTYILNEENLNKKIKSSADSAKNFVKIKNITEEKSGAVCPGAHNTFVTIENGNLPFEMIKDLVINDEKSIFAPYFSTPDHYRIQKNK